MPRSSLLLLAWVMTFGVSGRVAAQAPATAQTPPVTVPSVTVVLPNYNSVPAGEIASLEAGAFVARANDTSSGFYNPAGLVRAERTSLSGGSGVFQFGSVSPEKFSNVESSFQQIPAMFGFVLNDLLGRPNWAAGLSITQVNAWSQTVEAEVFSTPADPANRFRFSTDADFNSWLASVGVAYARPNRRSGVGVSIDSQYTSTSRRQGVADQRLTATSLSALTVASNGSASTLHLRATVGGQIQVAPSVRLGLTVRTPGLRVISGGTASLEGQAHAGAATTAVSFFDPDVRVQHKLPLEIKGGAGWTGSRAEVEVDLFAYSGQGQYPAFETDNVVTSLGVDGPDGAPVVERTAFLTPTVDSKAVVNVAVGGHYNLTADKAWVVHGGFATDRSPVGDLDTTFTKVHLYKLTVGLSARTRLLLGSVGLQYIAGESGPFVLGGSVGGSPLETTFKVSTVGLVYSFAVLF